MNFHELNVPARHRAQQAEGLLAQRADRDHGEPVDTTAPPVPTAGMDLSGVSPHGPATAPAAEAEPDAPAVTPAASLVVDDAVAEPQPGQLRKTEFLRQLEAAVRAEATAALAGTEHASTGCPYLTFWFSYYQGQPSEHVENVIHRYAPETQRATTASEYISLITARVRRGIEHWTATGQLTDVPEDVPQPELTAGAADDTEEVQHKERSPAARPSTSPQAVRTRLGTGRPLDSGVRTRMEQAFGQSFTQVRTHTGPVASRLSNEQNARAFTVGTHVAFGAGQYRPGTPVGEALIAHELAHVVQQRNAGTGAGTSHAGQSLEEDADRSAVAAVTSSLLDPAETLANRPSVATSLRSGLRLSRCGPGKKSEEGQLQAAQEYLRHLRDKGTIEAGADSKEKARKVVELWQQGQGQFILPVTLKVLLVNELLNVPTTDAGMVVPEADQAAVTTLLKGMTDREVETVMAKVGEKLIMSALQGDNRRLAEERKKKITPATVRERTETFDSEHLMRLRDEFIENAKKEQGKRLKCIQILSTQLEKLYESPDERAAVRKGTRSYTTQREYEGRVLAESTLPNLMSRVEESKLVADRFVTDFTRDPRTKQPQAVNDSPWGGVTKMVGGVQGWHFFTMALMDGYHSVSLMVENRPTGMFLYWADQNYTTSEALLSPGSVAGFRQYTGSNFDAYVLTATKSFWDDFYKHRAGEAPGAGAFKPAADSRTTLTIWKLRRTLPAPPQKPPPPAPTKPKPKRKRQAQ